MDMTDTIVPRSDQMNAEDLLAGPRTFTIKEVHKGASAEQPVDVILAEFPPDRPFKPSKTVRRIMVAAWGPDAAGYVGKRLTLYRDPAVRFGGQDVGGIRISHMSGIDKPLTIALTVTRGRRAPYKVLPLADAPTPPRSTSDTTQNPERITRAQQTKLHAALGELRLTEREDKLAFCGEFLERSVASSNDLTKDEATRLIDHIEGILTARNETDLFGGEA